MREKIAEATRIMGDILEIVDESRKSGPKTTSNQAKVELRTKALAKMRRDMELYPEDRWPEVISLPADYLVDVDASRVPQAHGGMIGNWNLKKETAESRETMRRNQPS